MSTDDPEQSALPDGIHDTDDLRRIWDALELLAAKVDPEPGGVTDGEMGPEPGLDTDGEEPPSEP